MSTVDLAYQRWDAGDIEGFLDLFDDDALFVVPGTTSVSGDHDKAVFRRVLAKVADLSSAGRHRQQRVCAYPGDDGAVVVFDNHFGPGDSDKYHSIHEWIFRDGRPHAWMLYLHEYDLFEQLWR